METAFHSPQFLKSESPISYCISFSKFLVILKEIPVLQKYQYRVLFHYTLELHEPQFGSAVIPLWNYDLCSTYVVKLRTILQKSYFHGAAHCCKICDLWSTAVLKLRSVLHCKFYAVQLRLYWKWSSVARRLSTHELRLSRSISQQFCNCTTKTDVWGCIFSQLATLSLPFWEK